MSKLGVWGGYPEIYAIAKLLNYRIIIYRNDGSIQIPSGQDYNTWPILIELIHEAANAGLEFSEKKEKDNHYNLAVNKPLAKKILIVNGLASNKAKFDDTDLRLKYKDLTFDGLKKSLHGNIYQLGLLTLVASRANQAKTILFS